MSPTESKNDNPQTITLDFAPFWLVIFRHINPIALNVKLRYGQCYFFDDFSAFRSKYLLKF